MPIKRNRKRITKHAPEQCSKFSLTSKIGTKSFNLPKHCSNTMNTSALWRSHHIKMVERMVGAKRGTGGSEGIGYLKTTLDKKFFPELWEARTYLDVGHGEGGCPFAH